MTSVKAGDKKNNAAITNVENNNSHGSYSRRTRETEICNICKNSVWKDSKHCYGGCDFCGWCHPEQADAWAPEAKTIADKQWRERTRKNYDAAVDI